MSCCRSCAHGRKCEGKKKRKNPFRVGTGTYYPSGHYQQGYVHEEFPTRAAAQKWARAERARQASDAKKYGYKHDPKAYEIWIEDASKPRRAPRPSRPGSPSVIELPGVYGSKMEMLRAAASRRNPNFLYLANGRRGRRRRNPEASNTWIYQANGKRRTRRMKIRGRKRPSQRYKAYLAARGRPFRYIKSKRRS